MARTLPKTNVKSQKTCCPKQSSSSKCLVPSPIPFSGCNTSGASVFEHGYLAGTIENLKHTALESRSHGGRPTTSIFGLGTYIHLRKSAMGI